MLLGTLTVEAVVKVLTVEVVVTVLTGVVSSGDDCVDWDLDCDSGGDCVDWGCEQW